MTILLFECNINNIPKQNHYWLIDETIITKLVFQNEKLTNTYIKKRSCKISHEKMNIQSAYGDQKYIYVKIDEVLNLLSKNNLIKL